MEKLKSSFKNLQEAITSIKPIGPICIQEAETQSFGAGELCSSLHYPCCTSSPSSATYFGPLELQENLYQLPYLEEDFGFSDVATTATTTSTTMFFFSPCTTKSIMEEAKPETGILKAQRTIKAALGKASFYEESITMSISSEDPYQDFRASMEEMVVAHELREWHSLQELLHCYLRLNERKNHKVIMLAFVDLLMQLMEMEKEV
ncbi:ovate family protein 13 [Musa troglodytarum]|uniref:Transcription repressor n=1 Tax=Musa troglodytarum TaxID=320322 RepID=A0A9E7F757_9LILI|nr:ovate family protein 13 [Musa troglodytarum]